MENITVDHPFLLNKETWLRTLASQRPRGRGSRLAGLVGAGRSEVLTAVCGVRKIKRGGKIFLNGKQITISGPTDAMAKGISPSPRTERNTACCSAGAIMRNISITNMKRDLLRQKSSSSPKRERGGAMNYYFKTMRVKAPKMSVLVDTLSGGNQQKSRYRVQFNAEPKV